MRRLYLKTAIRFLCFQRPWHWKHKNQFFESQPMAGFQKTDFENENCCFKNKK
jgi:hypothetical protein